MHGFKHVDKGQAMGLGDMLRCSYVLLDGSVTAVWPEGCVDGGRRQHHEALAKAMGYT